MIARESFEKSLPRFASAAPFLCLMLTTCYAPTRAASSTSCEEPLVHARCRQSARGGTSRASMPAVADEDGLAVQLAEHLDARRRARAREARG